MYRSGAKMTDIEDETGVPKSTAYLILGEQGVGPSRLPTLARRSGGEGISFIMERLLEVNAELTACRMELEAAKTEIEKLKMQVARLRHKA
jgi:hypothetical protein